MFATKEQVHRMLLGTWYLRVNEYDTITYVFSQTHMMVGDRNLPYTLSVSGERGTITTAIQVITITNITPTDLRLEIGPTEYALTRR